MLLMLRDMENLVSNLWENMSALVEGVGALRHQGLLLRGTMVKWDQIIIDQLGIIHLVGFCVYRRPIFYGPP